MKKITLGPGLEVIKLFTCSTQTEHEIFVCLFGA